MNTIANLFLKKLSVVVVVSLTLVLLAACSGGSGGSSTATSSTGGNTEESETYTLRMNSAFPAPVLDWEPNAVATERFAEMVKERTNGRLNIEIYYSNQLAGQSEALDALARGTFDLQNSTPSAWATKIQENNLFGLPFWSMGHDHIKHILRETEVGELYEQSLEDYGVKLLFYWPSAETGFMSTSPIANPKDMKGLVANNVSSIAIDFYSAVEAGAASVTLAELYEGYYRGTIDVSQFAFSSLESMKLHEVVKYITVPATLSPSMGFVTMSRASYDKLPADLQEALLEVSMEMEAMAYESSKKLSERNFQKAEEFGVEVVQMTQDGYDQFKEIGQETMWKKFAEMSDRTNKMMEVLTAENEKWMNENPAAQEFFDQYITK